METVEKAGMPLSRTVSAGGKNVDSMGIILRFLLIFHTGRVKSFFSAAFPGGRMPAGAVKSGKTEGESGKLSTEFHIIIHLWKTSCGKPAGPYFVAKTERFRTK